MPDNPPQLTRNCLFTMTPHMIWRVSVGLPRRAYFFQCELGKPHGSWSWSWPRAPESITLPRFAAIPKKNVAFYTRNLGLRMVKKTVNFDDPSTWHLYYGDETGRPGTALTFFAWGERPPAVTATAWRSKPHSSSRKARSAIGRSA